MTKGPMKARVEHVDSVEAMMALGAELIATLRAGDMVLLYGELGAGKTTLVRGALAAIGVTDSVRSPSYNLVQEFDTSPPVVHVDLYRLNNAEGLGLDDYSHSHLMFVEWPQRAPELENDARAIMIVIEFDGEGRIVTISR